MGSATINAIINVMRSIFSAFSRRVSEFVGNPLSFCIALLVVILWALSGQFNDYSDSWQLFINTGTTILTFLMVFLIQNTQNRDSKAVQLKLDELIRAIKSARNKMIDVEDLPDEDLAKLQKQYTDFRKDHLNDDQ